MLRFTRSTGHKIIVFKSKMHDRWLVSCKCCRWVWPRAQDPRSITWGIVVRAAFYHAKEAHPRAETAG